MADVDMYRVDLNAGQTLRIDVDAQFLDDGTNLSSLNSYVRTFDSLGSQLAANNDDTSGDRPNTTVDSYLSFTATSTGTYYFGLSSTGNTNYYPYMAGYGSPGSTVGAYRLQLLIEAGGGNQPPAANSDSYTTTQSTQLIRVRRTGIGTKSQGWHWPPDFRSKTRGLSDYQTAAS